MSDFKRFKDANDGATADSSTIKPIHTDDPLKENLIPKENCNLGIPINERTFVRPEKPVDEEEEETSVVKAYLYLFRDNLKSGITVGLVNLSLCISLAVASGSKPGVGIVSGIYAGLISGVIGGSHFNIIGPTGALSSFIKKLIMKYGESALPLSCVVVGVICHLTKSMAMDKYIDLFPVAVTEGFTVGVALILFINQVSPALGMENFNPETSIYNSEETHFSNTLIENIITDFSNLQAVNYYALLTFISFFLFIGLFGRMFPKFPIVIVATILGIVLGYLQTIGVIALGLSTLGSKYGELEISFFNPPLDVTPLLKPQFFIDCLPISVIAILETLISAKIADKMTKTKFDKKQELGSLSLSNIFVGLAGGLPVTAALARTSLNIKSGATYRASALINGLLVTILSIFFFDKFKYLPICVIGSIVCIVAVKMVDYHEIIHFYEQDKNSFFLILVGGVVSLIADPTIGLIVGMLVYFFMFTTPFLTPFYEVIFTKAKSKKGKFMVSNLDQHLLDIPVGVKADKRNFIIYRFIGVLNYMNIDHHERQILEVMEKEPNVCLILSLRYIYKVDIDTLDSLKLLLENIKSHDSEFFVSHRFILSGISSQQIKDVKDPIWFDALVKEGLLVLSEHFDVEWSQNEDIYHDPLAQTAHNLAHPHAKAVSAFDIKLHKKKESNTKLTSLYMHHQGSNTNLAEIARHTEIEHHHFAEDDKETTALNHPLRHKSSIRSPARPNKEEVATHFLDSDYYTTDNKHTPLDPRQQQR